MNIKNIMLLTIFQIKTNKKQIIGWSISIFAIMFLYMILFPSVQDMAQIKMEAMPEELMQFMGMDDFIDMSNYMSYFAMIYNIILIAISIFATVLGAGVIAKEEKNKTIEFLYAMEVSRVEMYISKFLTAYIGVILVIMSATISSIICGVINGGETFILMDVITMVKGSGMIPFVFLGVGTMIAGITSKVSGGSVGSIIVIISYVLGFLSTMVSEELSWFKYLSPFEILNPEVVVEMTSEVMMAMCGYLVVMLLSVVIGGAVYHRRDFQI
ncbi:MAG: ABC transporter permease subunit [Eubacteriales bacterium]